MSCLPKPVLRGHIKRRGIRGLVGAFCLAAVNGALYHFFVTAPREAAYQNFAATYDPESHYQEMVKLGYLDPSAFTSFYKSD